MPNFWRTFLKIQWFPLSILNFGQNSCFFGPTIFKIPQPTWHYCVLCTVQEMHKRQFKYFVSMCLTFFYYVLHLTHNKSQKKLSKKKYGWKLMILKSVHFKNTVARSSVLSKLWSLKRWFLIIHQLTLFWLAML